MTGSDELKFWIGISMFCFKGEKAMLNKIERIDRNYIDRFCAATGIEEGLVHEAILVTSENSSCDSGYAIDRRSKEIMGRILMLMSRLYLLSSKGDIIHWMKSPCEQLLNEIPLKACRYPMDLDRMIVIFRKGVDFSA
ncbi:hypothetical protein [Alcanivorax sp. 1008]|uniref:hypothetical protein n=1 Tax=Alcanivorax sp. 1008 TaxID=2816853 RepID=UPI001DFD1B0C|nr:hypothetical protein [Alcanivorax sp. 1008]MCC1498090.1 hypothetical protein [Alcanivorax sp. 1008]